jgi:hypothetical protein
MDANGMDVDQKPEMVIVTALRSYRRIRLTNLCASLRYWHPHHRVVMLAAIWGMIMIR